MVINHMASTLGKQGDPSIGFLGHGRSSLEVPMKMSDVAEHGPEAIQFWNDHVSRGARGLFAHQLTRTDFDSIRIRAAG